MEDYAKGNKGGSAAGGFAMTSFMQQQQPTTGGQSGFGVAKPAAMGTFGGTLPLVSGWGSTPAPAPAFGAPSTFGTQTGTKTGTGLFGQQAGTTTTNIFAKPGTTATPFNISAPTPATTGGFSFGSAAPATTQQVFGAPATASSSLFGAPVPAATTSTPFLGAFAPAPATGTVGFGAAAAPAPATGAFSLGGATPAPASGGGLFGGAATSASALSTGGGLFGKTPAAAPALAAPTGGFGFGSTAPATGGFGFGSTAPAAKPQVPSFSFASAPAAGGSLFGVPATAPPAGKGLWGGGTGGLFSSVRAPSTAPSTSLTGTAPAIFGGAPLFATLPAQQQQPLQALLAGHSQSAYGRTEPGSHGAGELLQKVEAVTRTSSALELSLGPSGGGEIPPTTEGSHEFYQMNGLEGSGRLASSMGRVRGAMHIAPRRLGGDDGRSSSNSLQTSQMNGDGGHGSLSSSARELVESNRLLSLSNSETTFSGVIDPRAFAGRSAKRLIINTPAPKASDALPGLLDAPPLITNGSTSNPDLPALPAIDPKPAPIAPTTASSITMFETPSKKKGPKELDFQSHGVRLPVHESEDQDTTAPPPSHRLSMEEQRQSIEYNVPLLRRPGYGCKPSLKDMSSMTDSELSRVTNFSIWHTGFGSITFLKPVDLRGVDLDAVVSIDRRDVAVYDTKEEKDKVPIGHGLNRPAIIAMHGVFPGSKSKKDTKTYQDGLKKRAEAMGAIHDKYNELEGVWTFRVPHFSRYALVIDDESGDSADEETAMQKLQRKNEDGESKKTEEMSESGTPSHHRHPAAALGLSIKWLGDVYPSGGSSSLAAAPVDMEFSGSLPIPSSLPHSIAAAAASSIDMEMDTSTSPLEDSSSPIGQHHHKPFLKTSVLQNTRWCRGTTIGGGSQSRVRLIHASPSTPDAHLLGNSPCLKIFSKVVAKNVETNRGEQQFGMKSSRVVASDFGLRMGWSVPVSWGPNGEIVWCGGSNSTTRNGKMKDEGGGGLRFSVYVDRLALGRIRGEGVERSLMVNKRHAIASSTATPRPEDAAVMKWSMSGSYMAMVNCVHDYIECSSALEVDDSSSSSLETRECWHLVSALWGQEKRGDEMEQQKQQLDLLPVPPYPHPPAYDADGCSPLDRRWLAIRKWLADAVQRKGQRKQGGSARRPSASAESKFLERLLAMRVDESAHLAAASTFSPTPSPRLATLIALAMGGDPFVREQLRMQLCQWDEAGASDLTPPAVRQTLELLSGGGASSSACGHVGASLGSEWLEQLVECLFYNAPEGEAMTLAQALAVFDDVMSCPPLTEYALLEEVKSYTVGTSSTTSISSGQEKFRKFSLIYHLLHLYATEGSAGLTRCLDPACLTQDPLDYSISWHLMLVLDGLKLPYPNPPVSVKSTITASIVNQLCLSSKNIHDGGGGGGALWPWAAFVLLYENNGWEYAASIDAAREIVMRFGYSATQEECTLSVEYLGLPEIWLQESTELFLQYQTEMLGNSTNVGGMSSKSAVMG